MGKTLKAGDVIKLPYGVRINAKLPAHFLYSDCVNQWDIERGQVSLPESKDLVHPLTFLMGEYVVTHTTMDGGGEGSHNDGVGYADGHHVWCVKTDDSGLEVDFFQSGDVNPQITDIIPIGRMQRKWTWVKEK